MSDVERMVSAADRIESAAHRMALLFEDGYGGAGVRLLEAVETDVAALRAKLQAAEIEKTDILAQRDVYLSRAEAAEAKMDNLAALVRVLVHSLRKVDPNNSNIIRALDYLKRHRLTGSILRSDEPQPKEIPESGGHVESPDCWCSPTVEEHPGGRLVIHNQIH